MMAVACAPVPSGPETGLSDFERAAIQFRRERGLLRAQEGTGLGMEASSNGERTV
jgi:hypothetical protein